MLQSDEKTSGIADGVKRKIIRIANYDRSVADRKRKNRREREQSIEILKKIVGERIEERTKGNRMKR